VQDKGFGFIQGDGGDDVFFHHSTVADHGFDDLTEGQAVEYTVEQGQGPKGKGPARGFRCARLIAAGPPPSSNNRLPKTQRARIRPGPRSLITVPAVYSRSIIIATALPPPRHSDTSPRFNPRSANA